MRLDWGAEMCAGFVWPVCQPDSVSRLNGDNVCVNLNLQTETTIMTTHLIVKTKKIIDSIQVKEKINIGADHE